ncbi:MAG TPA: hypothetical protein VN903_14295 [Polyangia bacterium]|nr:hypothetical protein [Polyangia bacterium]
MKGPKCYRCAESATMRIDCVEHRFHVSMCDDHCAETLDFFRSVNADVVVDPINPPLAEVA